MSKINAVSRSQFSDVINSCQTILDSYYIMIAHVLHMFSGIELNIFI